MENKLDLSNHTFKIGFNRDPPYTFTKLNEVVGVEPTMLRTMSQYFNFSMEFIDCNDVYGSKRPDGTWYHGMISKLSNSELDFGIGGVLITYERHKSLRYLYPHMITQLTYGTALPVHTVSFDALFRPFSLPIWICLFVTFILLTIFNQFKICLLIPKQRYHGRFECLSPKHHQRQRDVNLVWISFILLFRQPYGRISSLDASSKTYVILWVISCMILTNVYAGFLCSLLTIPTRWAMDSIHKLAHSCQTGHFIPMAQGNTSVFEVFSNSNLPTFQLIWNALVPVNDTDNGLRMVIENDKPDRHYAFLASRHSLLFHQLLFGINAFYIPPENGESSFYPILTAIPARPTFQYQEEFNNLIMRFQSSGLLMNWLKKELVKARDNYNAKQTQIKQPVHLVGLKIQKTSKKISFEQFSLQKFESIFYLYLFCACVSFFIFLLEMFLFRKKRKQTTPKNRFDYNNDNHFNK